jgi:hypothetical protein
MPRSASLGNTGTVAATQRLVRNLTLAQHRDLQAVVGQNAANDELAAFGKAPSSIIMIALPA